SHRSMTLHSLAVCMVDTLGVRERDTLLAVVPMFHAAAWGLPYAGVLAGSKMVFPGPHLDPTSLLQLMQDEKVTLAGGVPTIWLASSTRRARARVKSALSGRRAWVGGASAAPPAMIAGSQRRHNLHIIHAWGMTEMDPLGTIAHVKRKLADADAATQLAARS